MIPVQLLMLEDDVSDDGKHHQRDALLDDLQLHQREGFPVVNETYSVGY